MSATNKKGGSLSLTFNRDINSRFEEGRTYSLRIPFGEYNGTSEIPNSCTGYATLLLKIVPEYLTWKGGTDAVWYNDDNWDQSTRAELYMGGNNNDTDANGSDPIENAFAPLYFTKVTIDPKKGNNTNVLRLEDESRLRQGDQRNTLDLKNWPNLNNIQYDMAVNNTGTNNAIKVVPYYGNKVNKIYFQPKAMLMNQHYLDYEKAWVEFEMSNTEKRWSPLRCKMSMRVTSMPRKTMAERRRKPLRILNMRKIKILESLTAAGHRPSTKRLGTARLSISLIQMEK